MPLIITSLVTRLSMIFFMLSAGVLFSQNDPLFTSGDQWHLQKINAPAAWKYSKGEGVVVALLDTGVDYNHPELKGKVLVEDGYDFVNDDGDPMDDNGHGTAIAAILAAETDNAVGLASIGWNVKILPIKVMSSEMRSYDSQITKGIYHAVKKGARIISISISSPTKAERIEEAVNHAWSKGCIIVSSSGNTGKQEVRYPAALKNVIGVGAMDRADQQPQWATYGTHVALTAPGRRLKTISGENYSFKSGSSYATPLVSGTAALLAGLPYQLTNHEIVSVLKESADDLGAEGYDVVYGHGRLNAGNALKQVMKERGDYVEEAEAPELAVEVSPADELHAAIKFTIEELTEKTVKMRVYVPVGVEYNIMGSDGSPAWSLVYAGKGSGIFETFSLSIPNGYELFELEY